MNSHGVFIHIHQGCFAGTGAIVRLPQCQWSKPDGYGKISQCITTTKHSKAKTVCIFLGIYCTYLYRSGATHYIILPAIYLPKTYFWDGSVHQRLRSWTLLSNFLQLRPIHIGIRTFLWHMQNIFKTSYNSISICVKSAFWWKILESTWIIFYGSRQLLVINVCIFWIYH